MLPVIEHTSLSACEYCLHNNIHFKLDQTSFLCKPFMWSSEQVPSLHGTFMVLKQQPLSLESEFGWAYKVFSVSRWSFGTTLGLINKYCHIFQLKIQFNELSIITNAAITCVIECTSKYFKIFHKCLPILTPGQCLKQITVLKYSILLYIL